MRLLMAIALVAAALAGPVRAQLSVTASSELRGPLEEVRRLYLETTGKPIRIIYGSDGASLAQARAGGVDLVVLSDLGAADSFRVGGLAVAEPRLLAVNPVVGWVRKTRLSPSPDLAFLADSLAARWVISDTLATPDGRAVLAALRASGLWESLAPRVVVAPDPAAAHDTLATQPTVPDSLWGTVVGSAVLPLSVLWGSPVAGYGRWMALDSARVPPLRAATLVLKVASSRQENARAFVEFLEGPRARGVLRRYGLK